MTVLDRLMQTEGIEIQLIVISIVNQAISTFPDLYFVEGDFSSLDVNDHSFMKLDSSTKLYKIFKVLFNVFLYYVPGFVDNAASACKLSFIILVYYLHDINRDSAELISNALLALTTLITAPEVARICSVQLFPIAMVVYIGILIHIC